MMTAEIRSNRVHPWKFVLWLAIAAIIMLFAGLTSAYIVGMAQDKWEMLPLPKIFWLNTLIIIASSISIQWSVSRFRKYQYGAFKIGLLVTFLLGLAFLFGQYQGWLQMTSLKSGFGKEGFSDYVFAISLIHAAHIGGGLLIMLLTLLRVLFKPFNPNKLVNAQLMATYWHFVDVLWIYLFIFFQIKLA